jgi:2-keto-3-deoxy-L-rhamnonate aldolase RhmA
MTNRPNSLKRALAGSRVQLGIWCSLASALTAEVVGGAAVDWMLIDCEHAPNDLNSVIAQLRAVAPFALEPLVRLPSDDRTLIKQFLDAGARSLMIPNVSSAAQAQDVVASMRYPPEGARGFASRHRGNAFGRRTDYARTAHDEQLLCVQIESEAAVAKAAAIAAVDGVDVLFVGPNDLAASFGNLGNPDEARVQQAIGEVLAAARRAKKPAGIWSGDALSAQHYLEMGFSVVAIGSDLGLLVNGVDSLVRQFRRSAA